MATTSSSLNDSTDKATEFDEEQWDARIEALLQANDIEGARAEFDRQLAASIESGPPIYMTPEKWEELRLELHREADLIP